MVANRTSNKVSEGWGLALAVAVCIMFWQTDAAGQGQQPAAPDAQALIGEWTCHNNSRQGISWQGPEGFAGGMGEQFGAIFCGGVSPGPGCVEEQLAVVALAQANNCIAAPRGADFARASFVCETTRARAHIIIVDMCASILGF